LHYHEYACVDDNIDETYGINVQFEESEEEVCFHCFAYHLVDNLLNLVLQFYDEISCGCSDRNNYAKVF